MRISERQFGEVVVLDVAGPIVGRQAAGMIDATMRHQCRGGKHIVVANLRGVPAIDLAGLGAFVGAHITMREAGGVFSLACMTKRIYDLVAITRLLTVIDIFESVEDAVGRATPPFRGASGAAQLSMMSLGPIQRFLRRA